VAYRNCGGQPDQDQRQVLPEKRLIAQLGQGRRVKQQLQQLASEGWQPDVVMAHPSWGEVLFLNDVFPDVPLIALLEIDLQGVDLAGFDPELAKRCSQDLGANLGLRQLAELQAIRRMAIGVTATAFQRSTFPEWLHNRIAVIHEGVDVQKCRPDPLATFVLANGHQFRRGDAVISFGSRSLEPLRGLTSFLKALPELQRHRPDVHVVIVGQDGLSYGPPPPSGGSWRQHLLQSLDGNIDLARLHFTGHLPHLELVKLFQVTAAHVYFTAPYVLSWSMLEAMACGAVVVGSATAPVEEVISHGENGWLVPFFDYKKLSQTLLAALGDPAGQDPLRQSARRTILGSYTQESCTAKQISLLNQVIDL
jgi:glycosyltransferase involved in cell wall biosynthesis